LPVASAVRSSPLTVSETLPVALPPNDDVTLQPTIWTDAGTSDARCSTRASRSASVTSFFASASAIAWR
jgi:hypothetical protein